MALNAVTDWSTTPSNNVDVGGVGIQGSSSLASGNDALQTVMAQIATFITGATFTGTLPLTLTSTDAGDAAGPVLTLYRNSSTPAASDILGKLLFQGEDSAGNTEDYAEIYTLLTDATSGSEDATLVFRRKLAGVMTALTLFNSVALQKFTTSNLYTPTAGMIFALAFGVGAGAGAGGTGISSVGQLASSGGGGGGELAIKLLTAADVGASKTVTIGTAGTGGAAGNNNGAAGGDTSLGSLLIAKGGSPGVGNNANSGSAGGAGGTGGTGDILIPGQAGGNGAGGSGLTVETFSGYGGMSGGGFGTGARARRSESQPGVAGSGYGSGGSGGMDRNGSSARGGGDGTAGFLFILEFIQ